MESPRFQNLCTLSSDVSRYSSFREDMSVSCWAHLPQSKGWLLNHQPYHFFVNRANTKRFEHYIRSEVSTVTGEKYLRQNATWTWGKKFNIVLHIYFINILRHKTIRRICSCLFACIVLCYISMDIDFNYPFLVKLLTHRTGFVFGGNTMIDL